MQRRTSVHVQGLEHGELPIPSASRLGPFVITGGIRGVDRATGVMPKDLGDQVRLMFENLKSIVEAAGATCDGILKVTIWAAVPNVRDHVNGEWVKLFPDPASRPARHMLNHELPAGMLVQCEAFAVASTE